MQIKEWLKMGVVKPSNSPYNSPIFVVPKKDGSPGYVLDFRKLNSNSRTDKYSMKMVKFPRKTLCFVLNRCFYKIR